MRRHFSELTKEERAQNFLWTKAKARAKKMGLPFNIDESDIIIPKLCPLLRIPLSFGGDFAVTPSLDRIHNEKGYTKGNVWVISVKANTMKQNASIAQLIIFAKNVLENFDT